MLGASVAMFEPGDSEPKWTYTTGGPIPRSPVLGADGVIRVHSTDGFLHFVNADGKRQHDPAPVGAPLGWATPLVDGQNRTWVSRADGNILAIGGDGRVSPKPFLRTHRRYDSTGLIHNDTLYLACDDNSVQAVPLGEQRGKNRWQDPNAGRTDYAILSPLVLVGDRELLVISQDDRLHAFDLEGVERWSRPLPGQVLGSMVVDARDQILVAISQTPRNQPGRGLLLAVDRGTQQNRWEFATEAPLESTPVVGDDGMIYFGDNQGCCYAVDGSGQLSWRVELKSPVRSAGTFLAPGLVAFGLDDGSLVALRCSSQRLADSAWPKFQRTLGQSGCDSST